MGNQQKRTEVPSIEDTVKHSIMKTTVDIVLLPFYVLIVIVGVLGNALFIIVVRKHRSMYTTTNYLLTNVAVSDIISLVFCVPGIALRFFEHPSGSLGSFLCKFITMHHVAGIALLVSGLTLTLISAERYNALLQPAMRLHLKLEKRRVVIAICLIWGFAIAFVLPLFIEQKYVDEVQDCHMDWKISVSRVYWALLATIVGVSLSMMSFCYFQIVKAVYFQNILPPNCSSSEQDIKDKQKIITILITVTVLFFVCFLPFIIISAINISTESISYKLSYFLVYTSCCVNPVVYIFQSAKYRAGLKVLWRGSPAQRRQRSLES